MADMATELQDVRMPVDYRCPHCHGLTPQTAVVPHGKRPSTVVNQIPHGWNVSQKLVVDAMDFPCSCITIS